MPDKRVSKLTRLNIGEVSFCAEGMNPGARVSLFKNRDSLAGVIESAIAKFLGQSPGDQPGDDDMNIKDLEKKITELEGTAASLTALTKALDTAGVKVVKNDDGEVTGVEVKKEEEDDEIDKSKLPESVRKYLDTLEKAAKDAADKADAADKLAKAERDRREAAELAKEAEIKYGNLPGESSAKGRVLKLIRDSGDEDVRKTAEEMLLAGDKAMKAALDSVGSDVPVAGSAEDRLDALAKERAKQDDVPYAKAYDQVLAENPNLYTEYTKSRESR